MENENPLPIQSRNPWILSTVIFACISVISIGINVIGMSSVEKTIETVQVDMPISTVTPSPSPSYTPAPVISITPTSDKMCPDCPMLALPPPGWCDGGVEKIGKKNIFPDKGCFCYGPPTCERK